METLLIPGILLLGAAIALIVYAVLAQLNEKAVVRSSLRQLEGYEVENVRDQELLVPFTERAVMPVVSGLTSVGRRFTPVGYVTAVINSRPESPFAPARRWCELDAIGVVPEQRRRGVARELVRAVIEYAAAQGVQQVELASWSFNEPAHRAFERLGFTRKTLRFERPI